MSSHEQDEPEELTPIPLDWAMKVPVVEKRKWAPRLDLFLEWELDRQRYGPEDEELEEYIDKYQLIPGREPTCPCCKVWRTHVNAGFWPSWWEDIFGCKWTTIFEHYFDLETLRREGKRVFDRNYNQR